MNAVRYDNRTLVGLSREMDKLRRKHIQVGIFSDKAERSGEGEGIDNPTLGLVHERGSLSRHIPARSFLLMPLTLFFPKKLQKFGASQLVELVAEEGAETAAGVIGAEAEATVQEAFDTGGFGFWPKWSRRYARLIEAKMRRLTKRKNFVGPLKPGSLLIQSAQLRRSVEARVVE